MKWGGVKRSVRVGDLIQKEVAQLIHKGLKDPRLEDVTVTGVELTGDLRQAVLYFQVHGDEERIRNAVKGFRSAQPFIRTHLGKVLHIRVIPRFKFEYDATLERASRIESLFKQIEASPPPISAGDEEE